MERKRLQALARDSINEMRMKIQRDRELRKDSLMKAKKAEKLQKEALKDSLEQVKLLMKQARKAEKDSIRAAEELRKELEKKSKRKEKAAGDSLIDKGLQNMADSLQADSLSAKAEMVPLERMPGKGQAGSLSRQLPLHSPSLPAVTAIGLFVGIKRERSLA